MVKSTLGSPLRLSVLHSLPRQDEGTPFFTSWWRRSLLPSARVRGAKLEFTSTNSIILLLADADGLMKLRRRHWPVGEIRPPFIRMTPNSPLFRSAFHSAFLLTVDCGSGDTSRPSSPVQRESSIRRAHRPGFIPHCTGQLQRSRSRTFILVFSFCLSRELEAEGL